ncbi:MAG: hypothetical protein R3Y53_09125, partial [Bacillota bacterium]
MKYKLVSKKIGAIALGTILATSPLSVLANTQTTYKGQKALTITINADATIDEALDLVVDDRVTNKPTVTFTGDGSIGDDLTFEGNELIITAKQGAKNVTVTEASKVDIAKATSLTVTNAESVTTGTATDGSAGVTTVTINGVIEEDVNVGGGSAVTIDTDAEVGGSLTGTVGTLTVEAPITIDATLTAAVTATASVVLEGTTTIEETATIDIKGASIEIGSGVKIERGITTESDGTETSEPLFVGSSTITSLKTGTDLDLSGAAVTEAFEIVVPSGGVISVTGGTVSGEVTLDLSEVTTKAEVTLPDSVTKGEDVEINYTTSSGSSITAGDITIKDENGDEIKEGITLVQQASAPNVEFVSGENFGDNIVFDLSGVVKDENTAVQSIYYAFGEDELLVPEDMTVDGNTVTGLTMGAGTFKLDADGEVTILNEDITGNTVTIKAVVAQSGLDVSGGTAIAQSIKPSKEVVVVAKLTGDYSDLKTAIIDARDLLAGTLISVDGTDIDKAEQWVTEEVHGALSTAYGVAEAEFASQTATTQDEIQDFVDDL